MRRIAVATLFVAAIVALWQVMVASGRWSPMLLPSPLSVSDYLWSAMLDGSLLEAAAVTVRRLLTGYAIGC
jgi:NitT/TauT family transport system permease protein